MYKMQPRSTVPLGLQAKFRQDIDVFNNSSKSRLQAHIDFSVSGIFKKA